MAINRYKNSKKLSLPRVPRLNPVKYAKEMISSISYDEALRVTGQMVATGGHIEQHILEAGQVSHFELGQFKKDKGFWQTAHGYIKNLKKEKP